LGYQSVHAAWFAATQALFNRVVAFYFEVIAAHLAILDLSSKEALTALETLTHTTSGNPHPVMPLSCAIPADIPAMFRRAAIHAALGSARSFSTHLEKWRTQKEKAQAKGRKFTIHPPVPPRTWNRSVTLYAGQWKERLAKSIMLKMWTGSSWAWIKCHLHGPDLPAQWEMRSAQLVRHGAYWWLHTPLEQALPKPGKVAHQLGTNPDVRICSVDLNITKHLAVCTIQTVEGTVMATRFIGGGKELHGLRKRQLGRIARNRRKTGIIAQGEQDNVALWTKIRALGEESAHQVSHRIVEFAKEYHAHILVFEHLGHFRPQKGKYSKRGNEKRSYWLRGKIFKYCKYKAWNEGIVTCRVSPSMTSRECARCCEPIARYEAGKPTEGYTPGAPLVYCPQCHMHGNSDRNASLVIGKRLLARYQMHSQEKPPTPLHAERPVKTGGVRRSQDA
jgi:putative transposase